MGMTLKSHFCYGFVAGHSSQDQAWRSGAGETRLCGKWWLGNFLGLWGHTPGKLFFKIGTQSSSDLYMNFEQLIAVLWSDYFLHTWIFIALCVFHHLICAGVSVILDMLLLQQPKTIFFPFFFFRIFWLGCYVLENVGVILHAQNFLAGALWCESFMCMVQLFLYMDVSLINCNIRYQVHPYRLWYFCNVHKQQCWHRYYVCWSSARNIFFWVYPIVTHEFMFAIQGYGTLLMEEAEKICVTEHRSVKLAVISGVGTRHYYRKLGYELEGPYMVKFLRPTNKQMLLSP